MAQQRVDKRALCKRVVGGRYVIPVTGGPYRITRPVLNDEFLTGQGGRTKKEASPKDIISEIERSFSQFKMGPRKTVKGGMISIV